MQVAVFDLMQATPGHTHRDVYQHTFEHAEIAERGGVDTYFLAEHHFDHGYCLTPSPNLVLAALAQRTKRIRLGTMTTVLPYHHPLRVAEEIRELDMLSDGRLEVAFGRGAIRLEQQGWGIDRSDTSEMFETSFRLIRRFLTEPEVESYESRWWSGGNVAIVPDAVQKPYPPIWLTAVSETSSYKAGRLGLHCCTSFRSIAECTEAIANYRAGWEEWEESNPGVPPGKYGTMNHIFVAETIAEARKWAQPHLEGWLGNFVKILSDRPVAIEDPSYETHKRAHDALLACTFDELIEQGRIVFGTPDQCVEQISRLSEPGVDLFMGYFQFGGLDFAAGSRSLQLFCNEVLPKLRRSSQPANGAHAVEAGKRV